MTTFLTSDTHFGHQGILEWMNRPFASVEAINDGIVAIWNAVVKPRDIVWHLGDFSLGPKGTAEKFFRRLNGSIHLVKGNHDGSDVKSCSWASVHDMASIKHNGVKFTLCHYPMLSWPGSAHNRDGVVRSIQCYGHVHGTPHDARVPHLDPCRVDVGVDMHSYAPVSVDEVLAQVRQAVEMRS